ncbi:MAG TPA: hypothetical protein VN775_08535 [Opitutaceae bacterium]|nr:hypothetical protein [Opitutaceae bacterium]
MDLQPLTGRDAATVLPGPSAANARPALRPKPGATAAWILILLALIVAAGLYVPGGWNLVVISAALVAVMVVLGRAIVDRPMGVLINEQNIMSLSRFQMAVWTIVVIASYFSYALLRIKAVGFAAIDPTNKFDPLDITIDPHLLLLMGMSATSFVASPLILGTKKDKEPDTAVTAKTAQVSGDSQAEVEDNRQGTLYANTGIADARLTDLFQGDELGNTMHIDMAKVQMFFFTVISALAYLILVYRNLKAPAQDLGNLPVLSDGVVYALGISHAGYLASKGIDHTPVQQ